MPYGTLIPDGTITAAVQTNVKNNGTAFGGNIGAVGTAGSITDRLLANNASLASVLVIAPGAEIINRTGNLTLGVSAVEKRMLCFLRNSGF